MPSFSPYFFLPHRTALRKAGRILHTFFWNRALQRSYVKSVKSNNRTYFLKLVTFKQSLLHNPATYENQGRYEAVFFLRLLDSNQAFEAGKFNRCNGHLQKSISRRAGKVSRPLLCAIGNRTIRGPVAASQLYKCFFS